MEISRTTGTSLRTPAFIFLFLCAGIFSAGYFYYQAQKRHIVVEAQNHMAAIAGLKTAQIAEWRHARFDHQDLVFNNPLVVNQVKAFLANPADKLKRRNMLEWMESFRKNGLFSEIMLLDALGKEVLAAPEGMALAPYPKLLIEQAILKGKPLLTAIHVSKALQFPHVGAVIPLTLPEAPHDVVGVFYMYASLEHELYPMLQRWPVPSKSSETLLVSREDENVLFLNEWRNLPAPGKLPFKLPLKSGSVEAAAVQGREGMIEGVDYSGAPVLAVAKKVPGLDCHMIAKTERREVYAPLHEQLRTVGIGMGILIIMAAASLGLWWWHQRSRLYLELYKERKNAAESNSMRSSIVESSDDAIIGKSLDGIITSWNSGAERIYGYSQAEITGQPITILMPPERQTEVTRFLAEIKRGGCIENLETVHLKKNGTKIAVALTISPISDSDGNVVGMSTIARDITGHKLAEEALRESEERFRNIVEASPAGMHFYRLDDRGEFILTGGNPAADRITGIPHKSAVGKNMEYAFPGMADAKKIELCRKVASGKLGSQTIEGAYQRGDFKGYYKAHVFRTGPAMIAIDFDDVTGHKQAEEALRLGEEQLRSLNERDSARSIARRAALSMMQDADLQRQKTEDALQQLEKSTQRLQLLSKAIENNPILVVITDRDGTIEYVNPSFTEVTGYAAEEVIGKNPRLLKSGCHPPEFYKAMWETIISGRQWRGEICNKRKNGELYWESTSITPVEDASGNNLHYVAVKEDITERKHFIGELEKAKLSAESANRAKSLFLANMSHEIRTPMNSILGFSQLLQRDHTLNPMQRRHLETINRSGEYLLSLINDILEMSKIEAGRVVLNMSAINLHQLIAELETMFRIRAEDKGLSFAVERQDNVPQYVTADGSKLRQVLINLLGNAVKFTDKGHVSLRIGMVPGTEQSPRLIFDVEDTGMGIAAEEMDMLFKHFQQTQAGRKSGSGTGLGLAISREFVRLMGGDITVASRVGEGSTFHFEIQAENGMERIIDKNRSKIPAQQVLRLKPEQPVYRVLIVDDKKDNRELLSLLLDAAGFETRQAESGPDGIRAFEEWNPHLILMDMRMPEMDGVEAIRRIRETVNGSQVRILSLTASTFMEDRDKAFAVGADDFLGKPFIEAELFEKIRELLHVEYLYDDSGVSGEAAAVKSGAEIVAMLAAAKLPGELITELQQAIADGDLDRMLVIIDRIAGHSRELADALRSLAEHFDYQKLQDILDGL